MNAAGAGGGEDPNNNPHNNPHKPDNVTKSNKRSKARRKTIENRRIENEESRPNTFAEHRTRLNGRANEQATLCDTQVAFSGLTPNGGNIAFGSPFIREGREVFMRQFGEQQSRIMAALNARYNHSEQRVHAALRRRAELMQRSRELREADAAQGLEPGWWERPVDEMSIEEVDQNMEELDRLHRLLAAAQAEIRNLDLHGEDEEAGPPNAGGGANSNSKGDEAADC